MKMTFCTYIIYLFWIFIYYILISYIILFCMSLSCMINLGVIIPILTFDISKVTYVLSRSYRLFLSNLRLLRLNGYIFSKRFRVRFYDVLDFGYLCFRSWHSQKPSIKDIIF